MWIAAYPGEIELNQDSALQVLCSQRFHLPSDSTKARTSSTCAEE